MKKTICFLTLLTIALSVFTPFTVNASSYLDEIENYEITINMRNDGTMDIKYHIDWKVLDDSSEGPLKWVEIGVPNKHTDLLKALTDNISDIKNTNNNGNYVKINFDRSYKAGETVTFEFSIHQSYMYTLDHDKNLCYYNFTPGWFDEIEVKSITVKWNNKNVIENDADKKDGQYLIWTGSLDAGEKLTAYAAYKINTFSTNEDEQYKDESNGGIAIGIVFIILFAIIILIVCVRGSGSYRRGFGTGYYVGGGHGGCACVSSCACACACAGGGRAGCSAKNFYGASIQTDMLKENISKD